MRSLTEHFTSADAAPEDVIVAKVQRLLAGDDKLVQIFGAERIEALPFPDAPDWRDAPRLQIFHAAVPEEDQFPGNAAKRQVAVVVRIRFDWREWQPTLYGSPVGEWPYAVPSLATVENHVLRVIRNAGTLVETINGRQVALSHTAPTIGPFLSAGADQDQHAEYPIFFRDCRAEYVALLDHTTGRILNAETA